MSADGPLLREIGAAVMDDDLLREAVLAYSEHVSCDIPTCVSWLLKHALAAPGFGYLSTRQVTEFVPSPKLEKHRAEIGAAAAAPKPRRRPSALKLVSTNRPAAEETKG